MLTCTLQPLSAKSLPGELAAKNSALRLTPASPWQLELADDRCRLAREFQSAEGPGVVLFEQIAPGPRFDMILAGPDFARNRTGAWIYGGMRSDVEMVTIDPLEYDIAGYDHALALASIAIDDETVLEGADRGLTGTSIDPAAADLVERIVIQRSTTIISFETGNMKAAFEALNTCSRDLLGLWGLDAEDEVYHPARMPDASVYFSRLNHERATTPGSAGHDALLRVRAVISRDGSVSDCHHEYVLSSGGPQADVCEDIQEMQFEAATDAGGEPIASVFSLSMIMSKYDPWTADAHGGRWGRE